MKRPLSRFGENKEAWSRPGQIDNNLITVVKPGSYSPRVRVLCVAERRRKAMAKRRPSGDGMVRKREDGRWEGRIVVGHKENGDSIFRYVYADTQKEQIGRAHV